MANKIKLKGTTENSFEIGLNKQTFNVSGLTAPRVWNLPDSDGSAGYSLATDGSGNLSWAASGAASSTPYVPLTIGALDTFAVPANTQILYSEPIDVIGSLVVNGELIEVNPGSIAVNAQVPQLIPAGGLFTVGSNKQVAFDEDIIVAGDLEVFGDLIDTIKIPTGVTAGTYTNATVTVDVYGKIGYAASGSGPSAAGSTYNIQRNSYGSFYGTNDLNYDTSTSAHWFKVRNGGTFLATFGANNSNPAYNTTTALFIDNVTNTNTITLSTSDKTNGYTNAANSISVKPGNALQTSGGTSSVNAGHVTVQAGYAYVNGGTTTVVSGGRFTLQGGDAIYSPTSIGIGAITGGGFFLTAGAAYGHTGQPVNGGGFSLLAGDAKEQGTGYYLGLGGALTLKAGGGTTPGKIQLMSGNTASGNYKAVIELLSSQVVLTEEGQGLSIKEGTNAKQGIATLVSGTVTMSNTSVTANSRIFLTTQDPNSGTPGFLWVSARTAGTDFTIQSSSILDTSIVAYEIFEPS